MGLESDAEWLRDEANRIFDRLNQVARNLQNPRRAEVQKAGDVALMAAELCEVLREINKRGLFKALARDVAHDLKGGSVSVDVIRADIEKVVKFERELAIVISSDRQRPRSAQPLGRGYSGQSCP